MPLIIDPLAALIVKLKLELHGTAVRLRRRASNRQRGAGSSQRVAREDRPQPFHIFNSASAHAGAAGEDAIREHPHIERRRMPARSDEPPVESRFCRNGIRMHRLHVELIGETDDLGFANCVRAIGPHLAGSEVLKK